MLYSHISATEFFIPNNSYISKPISQSTKPILGMRFIFECISHGNSK